MMRVAQKGTVVRPVKVHRSTPKQVRSGIAQYTALNAGFYGRIDDLRLIMGEGDTIEEAVDAVSEQL
jgi:hypothetical protein